MATDLGSDELSDTAGGEHNQLQKLGKYRIEKRIGAGGMGTVFLAVDNDLNRTVALKVLPKDRAQNPVLVRRFKAEGQAAAHMEHPNIVRVFEAGEADGFLYMALEYIEGIDVHELVERRGVVPVKRSVDIIRQTTLALQHAHEKGIVHRDIKPSNLLIKRDGSVKLADMGLARSVDETLETNITRAGTTVGTVDYMSPEQARNSKAADVRSDIYSLGCTWYHMLTGHPPFPDGGMTNKLQSHAVSSRPDPRAENDRIPEGIVAIIQRMMACKPEDRYQTPQELLDDLVAAGRMHRTVDESALAALANEQEEPEEVDDEIEPVVRVGDIDDLDLAALQESGEHDVAALAARPRPIKPRAKSKQKPSTSKAQRRQSRTTSRNADEVTVDEPIPAAPAERAFAPIEPETSQPQQAAARRSMPAPGEPEPKAPKRNSRHKSTKPETSKVDPRGRSRRHSVTTTGGASPELPAADLSQPVDGSTKAGIDLDKLKVVLPAVLVIAILVGIGYALMRGGDSLGLPTGTNPYSEGQPSEEGPKGVTGSSSPATDRQPDKTPGDDPQAADPPAEPPQVAEQPFPGAEDAPPLAANEQPLIPGWVNAFRQPAGQAERTLVVRRRPKGKGQVGSINEAVKQLPLGGGTIEIDGDGPFLLEAVDISNYQFLRIQAAHGRRPVIQLVPGEHWKSGGLVTIRGTQLEFEGLHFVLVDAGPADADLFDVQNGNVAFRDCSISLEQLTPTPMTAIRLNGQTTRLGEAASGKCLLENVVIRGANLTAVALEGPEADLVAGNCLLASGEAPAVVVNDTGGGFHAAGASPPARVLRLLATTVLSSQSTIELRHASTGGDVVPTDVMLRRSLLVRPVPAVGEGPTAMASLIGWPQGSGGLGGPRVAGLAWQTAQSTFVGWSHLLRLTNAAGESLDEIPAETDAWRKFWNQGLRSDAIVAESIPPVRPETITPESIHPELSVVVQPLKDGQIPGCRASEFASQPIGLIAHVVAAMRLPYEPEWLGNGMSVKGEPFRFDLGTRRSLSHYLSSDACPDGTHVVAFGGGIKELEPFVIENKSIRLEFESVDKPLVIQPTAGRDGVLAEEAFITVRNGTLDLVAAPLKLPASNRRAYPKSLLLLENASLAVRHCSLEGPRVDVEALFPLIRTSGAGEDAQPRSLLLENSFFVSLGPILSGEVRWESLMARNCVLVSQADAISLTVNSPDQLPAGVVLDHCTIAAGGAAIRADVEPSAAVDAEALVLHSRACVFAGSLNGSEDAAVVVAHSAGAAQNHSLVWWGSANGYSDRLAGSVIDGNGRPGNFSKDWQAEWGEGHEAHPLTGKADVLFLKPLPDLRLVEPKNFQLSDSATAATWGRGGTPIGANVAAVGPTAGTRDDPRTDGTTSEKTDTRPGRNNPGF